MPDIISLRINSFDWYDVEKSKSWEEKKEEKNFDTSEKRYICAGKTKA